MKTTQKCSIPQCDNPVRARGWCAKHHARWVRHGNPTATGRTATTTCSVEDCDRPHVARGLCDAHYRRLRAHGDPLRGGPLPKYVPTVHAPANFDERVEQARGGCLVWTGPCDRDGYGKLKVEGRSVLAHRYAWERTNGAIPTGLMVDHVCHNPACVNLNHLRLATHAENSANRAQTTAKSGARNVHRAGAKWEVRITANGKRHYFGTFKTVEEAAIVAERERQRLFGVFSGNG